MKLTDMLTPGVSVGMLQSEWQHNNQPSEEGMTNKPVKQVVEFYVLAFCIAWVFWWPMALNFLGIIQFRIPQFIGQSVGAYAPLISLFILNRFRSDGLVKSVFDQLIIRKKFISWYLIAAFLPIILSLLTTVLRYLVGDMEQLILMRPDPIETMGWIIIFIIPVQFIASIFSSPLGEEPGWRGYVYKDLHPKLGIHKTSILVGTLWWIWHIPLFITLGEMPSVSSYLVLLGHSFLIDFLFIFSGCNLLVAMLYHQGINTALIFFNPGTDTFIGVAILWAIVILSRIFWMRKESHTTIVTGNE
ncbi:MAG: CPBP family intramembrane metalloprotease [Candidatus Marinimicrobia bacterium]|nr:CPBP family intramembrane metalloprotease [Candidatus Neomarinimicrobiota bacterium]